jgi:putative ABC transport system permease protein
VEGVRGRTLATTGTDTFLATLGIDLIAGRNFTPQESARSARVAVISETTARQFWPGRDPVGRRFELWLDFRGNTAEFEVIGVAKDVRFANLTRVDPGHVYIPVKAGGYEPAMLRIQGPARAALASIRGLVQSVAPELSSTLVLESVEEGPLWLQRLAAQAMAAVVLTLAGLAMLLAGVGIYGVMAYLVSQRTREIGIRMALGAAARDVVREVVLTGLRPVFVGIAVGIAAAAALSAVLHSTLRFPGSSDFLYGVSFYDPATFVGLSGFLLAVAAMASAIPARRATRVNPLEALRYE